MNIFTKEVVQRGKIPFEIQSDKTEQTTEGQIAFRVIRTLAESGEFPEMTHDEINKEIEISRSGNK